jgi:VCBS repeat-containing protein
MFKNHFLNGIKVLLTIGLLLSLVGPTATLAQTPVDKTVKQDDPILENTKPVGVADAYTLDLDISNVLTVPAPGVLGNDSDPEGDAITAQIATQPAFGYVVLSANGCFTYTLTGTPTGGTDHFTYKARDAYGLLSNPITVTITITGGNEAPVAAADAYITAMNTALVVAAPGVLTNDTDPDGDSITAMALNQPAHGTLVLSSNGGFTYTPEASYSGSDIFTYQAYDGTVYSSPAQVTITVSGGGNTAPEANADSYTTTEGVQLVVIAPGVLGNDFDAEGDILTTRLWVAPLHGNLVLNADGSFVYTPVAGYDGQDQFTYKAFDGELESFPAVVTITVNPLNTAPVAAADTYTTTINTTLTVVAPGVLLNDYDADGNPLTAELLGAPPALGILDLNADGSFTYVPAEDYIGNVTFTYQAYDGMDYSEQPAQVTIEVQSTNTAPLAVADNYLMLMNTTLSVDAGEGVLANDTDPDADTITAVLLGPAAHGTLILNDDGAFIYTPTEDYYGPDQFTYQADDGLELSPAVMVSINVKQANTAPLAFNDIYAVELGLTLTVLPASGVLVNDLDADTDPLTAVLVDNVDHGILTFQKDGSFTYVMNVGYLGLDSFTYQAYDGLALSAAAEVTINVTGFNIAPIANPDNYVSGIGSLLSELAPGVMSNDYDINGDALTAELVTTVSHGTLILYPNGSFVYLPNSGYAGLDSFTYKVFDGITYSPTVSVTINLVQVDRFFLPLTLK